jgi:Ankyrin repeat
MATPGPPAVAMQRWEQCKTELEELTPLLTEQPAPVQMQLLALRSSTDRLTLLHVAALVSYAAAAQLLSAGAQVHALAAGGYTPLQLALSSAQCSEYMVQLLLSYGASTNRKAGGYTALEWCVSGQGTQQKSAAAKMLLQSNPALIARGGSNGGTALAWAVFNQGGLPDEEIVGESAAAVWYGCYNICSHPKRHSFPSSTVNSPCVCSCYGAVPELLQVS